MNKLFRKCISLCVTVCFVLLPQSVYALPQGQNVVGGNASFNYSPNQLTVNQTTNRLATEWDSFSIGAPETVRFIQPATSSIALNKVVKANPSQILGSLKSNGRVFLINPNGIVFGANSKVDTAGMIVSTLDLDMDINDFINGNGNEFTFSGPGGSVVNYGNISLNAPGGYAAFLGSSVKNAGTIEAELGTVVLAAGEKMTLNLDPAGLISAVVDIEKGTDRNDDGEYAAVNNRGTIIADGGKVILSADVLDSVFTSAVNNDGIIEAGTSETVDGEVLLRSNQNIELNGEIHASRAIDAYAAENIYLGTPIDELMLSAYWWNYIKKDSRTYKFKEFGYYYDDGSQKVVLAQGEDIGKDAGSPLFGFGLAELPGAPQGLYIVMDPLTANRHTLYEDPALNPDGLDHLQLKNGTEYWWEDIIGLGDRDFNDVIVDFKEDLTPVKTPDAVLDAPDIFLTAKNGFIQQESGEINAENLMLGSNTGISGTGGNGGIETHVDNVSAFNKTDGDIRVSNVGQDLTVADLSGKKGLNSGVCGTSGVTNCATDGQVNIEALQGDGADLHIDAPIHSHGEVTLLAEGDITQTGEGDITVHNPYQAPGAPANVASPSHTPGEISEDRTVDVTWELPENVPGLHGLTATAQGGEYKMAAGAEIKTQGGDAAIQADGDVTLALIDAQNGDVTVTSDNGSVIDGDGGSTPSDHDVIAHHIDLLAPNGTVGAGDAIDLGSPYDFSYRWDNAGLTTPDSSVDPYISSYDEGTGDWTFGTTSDVLADGSWWFHVATLDHPVADDSPCPTKPDGNDQEIVASDLAHAGPFIFETVPPPPPPPPPPPEEETLTWEALQEDRVYYEILDPSRFLVYEPVQRLGLYAYHPISSADLSAFDNIQLDSGAYDFISDKIEMKEKANPYFGLE